LSGEIQQDWESKMALNQTRGFNAANFSAYLKQTEVLKTHDYILEIPVPPQMPQTGFTQRNVEFACDSVNFPMMGLVTYNGQRYSYGPIEANPTLNKFSPLTCTFICDKAATIDKFFRTWLQKVANYDLYNSISATNTIVGGTAYEIGYTNEYAVDIYLRVYDETGVQERYMRFREAYPVEISDIGLGWGRLNEIMKIPVVFSFTDASDMDLHGAK
jgi:hypothetical protein